MLSYVWVLLKVRSKKNPINDNIINLKITDGSHSQMILGEPSLLSYLSLNKPKPMPYLLQSKKNIHNNNSTNSKIIDGVCFEYFYMAPVYYPSLIHDTLLTTESNDDDHNAR